MSANHVVIWIDHREAHILYFDSAQNELIKSSTPKQHLHHKANAIGRGKSPEDTHFYHDVITAVKDVKEILIVGPGSAKTELQKHALKHDAYIAKRIVGVETLDHPTDKEILAYAAKYFHRVDQLKGV